MTAELSRTDIHALGRALQTYRKFSARNAVEVRDILRSDGWTQTARYCAKKCQQREQKLSYEETPPCDLELDERLAEPDACRDAMAALLRRLFRNGLSRWEPSPERACQQAEQQRREASGIQEKPSAA
jgi:hypothetical protein